MTSMIHIDTNLHLSEEFTLPIKMKSGWTKSGKVLEMHTNEKHSNDVWFLKNQINMKTKLARLKYVIMWKKYDIFQMSCPKESKILSCL